jgi:hypothetical protein
VIRIPFLNRPHKHSLFNPADFGPPPPRQQGAERWWTVAGLDIGQVNDPAALCVLSRRLRGFNQEGPLDERWRLLWCKNFPLGTDYSDLARDSLLVGADVLVYDATGGRQMMNVFRTEQDGIQHDRLTSGKPHLMTRLRPINLVSSLMREAAIRDKGIWSIPKHELVAAINIGAQGGRVIPAPQAAEDYARLLDQCRNFEERRSKAGNRQYGAPGHAADDMTIAFALACWWCFRFGGRSEPAIRM